MCAGVAELVDAPDSKSGSFGSVGSIPTLGTIGQSRAGNKKEQLTLLFFISQTATLTFLYECPNVDKPSLHHRKVVGSEYEPDALKVGRQHVHLSN